MMMLLTSFCLPGLVPGHQSMKRRYERRDGGSDGKIKEFIEDSAKGV